MAKAKPTNQQPQQPKHEHEHKHIEELEDMRNRLAEIGDAMLASASANANFDHTNFDQVAVAYHAIASIVGYPIPETE